jgi:hypothetical protein
LLAVGGFCFAYETLLNAQPHPGGFSTYSSRTFKYVESTVKALRAEQRELRRSYDGKVGVFPCRTFNLGGNAATYPHLDKMNLTQSWCSVTALGTFEPDYGGDLVLWDFGLTIRFPPGSTVLLPSSLLVHSNASIRQGETRYSIVQYAAGGIFRWADNKFRTERKRLEGAAEDDIASRGEKERQRWSSATKMFSKIEDLAK